MLRITAGWSLTFVLVVGGVVACSSKSTDEGTGMGGNGAIVGGSSNGGGPSNAGGSNNTGGSGQGRAGTATGTGGTGTGGTNGLCADDSITCVDALNASVCNPDTGLVETFNCVDEFKTLGFVSSGCTKDALNGDGCAADSLADPLCSDGVKWATYCENLSSEQSFNAYVNCFQDNNGAQALVRCFSKYVSDTMKTSADCVNAEDACLGTGAGGAPPTMTGAGGASDAGGAGGAP